MAERFPLAHTNSYYASTANDRTEFAPLRGAVRADVCVIGGGLTGIATALSLAERDYNVHVLEANRVAWGASGRNGGQMIGGISGEPQILKHHGPQIADLLWDMRWTGHDIIRERVARYGIECDLKDGYVDVAIKPRHMRDLDQECETLNRRGFASEFRLLGAAETAEVVGSKAYLGALLNMGNGHLHPLNLCVGEARAAVAQGATIYERSPVTHIDHGDKVTVHTADGSVTADFAVIAGNAYQLVDQSLSSLLFPVRSYIIATQPLSPEQQASVNPRDVAVCDPNYILEYFRLSADKRLLFGGRCNYFGEDPAVIAGHLLPRMTRIYPQLAGIGVDFAWGGSIGVTVNRVPQLGRVAPNVFFAQGYSGHGVNVTHLSGQVMADAVAGTFERLDVFAAIKPVRIPGARRFAKPLVSLGMFFYGLRDKL